MGCLALWIWLPILLLACDGIGHGQPIEFRVVAEDDCQKCEAVAFQTPLSDRREFLVPDSPDFVLDPRSVVAAQSWESLPLRANGKTEWVASISIKAHVLPGLLALRDSGEMILVSIDGATIALILSTDLASRITLRDFETREDLLAFFDAAGLEAEMLEPTPRMSFDDTDRQLFEDDSDVLRRSREADERLREIEQELGISDPAERERRWQAQEERLRALRAQRADR